jgi:hypothetical protein
LTQRNVTSAFVFFAGTTTASGHGLAARGEGAVKVGLAVSVRTRL